MGQVGSIHAAQPGTSIDVVVAAGNGKPAQNLSASRFVVRANGHEYRPDRAVPFDAPASLALVLDVSASATNWRLFSGGGRFDPELRIAPLVRLRNRVEAAFIQQLRPGDRGLIALFARRLLSMDAYSGDQRVLLQSFDRLLASVPPEDRLGPTPIWDALLSFVSALPPDDAASRPAIVLVTDGEESESRASLADVIARAVARQVSVNVISLAFDLDIPQSNGTVMPVRPNRDLGALAAATGGIFLFQGEPRPYRAATDRHDGPDWTRMEHARWPDISQPLRAATAALHRPYRLHVPDAALAEDDRSAVAVDVDGFQTAVVRIEVPGQ
jgi:hypothetical protein